MKKNLIKHSIFSACIFLINFGVLSQGSIGIGTASPNSLAVLDITATNKGMLVPRVALVSDTSPISGSKPNGLLLWNTNVGYKTGIGFYYWNGSTWASLAQVINTVSNSGIIPAPTATNKAKSWSTDHQGNPAWRRPNKTTEYINNF
jgi:hypothetical protein